MPRLLLIDHRVLHLVGGADRHGRFRDDDLVAFHVAANRPRRGDDVLQIGGAVLAGRRADSNELQLRMRYARGHIGREAQTSGMLVALHDGFQAGLEDRNLARVQARDLALVEIEAEDVVAGVREAGAGDEPDVARADDGDIHGVRSNSSVRRGG